MPAYLIEHPKGLVLFDTGLVPAAAQDPEGVYGELAAFLGLRYTPEQTVDRQLEALGYRSSDVRYVIASHTHFDHTGGLHLFPDAEFFVCEGDMRYAYWPDPAGAALFRREDLDAVRGTRWREVPRCDVDVSATAVWSSFSLRGTRPGS
ncbi:MULTISPECIES: MBL fold metallo-hydrolase [Saccharomonospora]|uniref:MBL fold metallo-hydrolase n=1 Tax=Saccharomonospora TaxID=1851 RepID=UPI0022B6B141|nr:MULTISPECIES: MBL fold metallo-hydrolase [Saccharomonospora]